MKIEPACSIPICMAFSTLRHFCARQDFFLKKYVTLCQVKPKQKADKVWWNTLAAAWSKVAKNIDLQFVKKGDKLADYYQIKIEWKLNLPMKA